ncbi:transposase family protein [Hymenobacter sp.]|uniref:transposase family protein n=1 Tax=Hymenobacter sp. TaxID=1898978 RepID=UPI0039C8A9AE
MRLSHPLSPPPKKRHTLKWLLICTLSGQLLWVSKAYSGRTHDFAIFEELFAHLSFKKYRIHVDTGFIGIKNFIDWQ